MKTRILLSIWTIAVALTACEHDVLDKGPLDVIDENIVWSDPQTAELYLNDLYNYLSSYNIWDNMDNMSDLTEGGHSWLACYTYNYGEVSASYDPYGKWSYYRQIRRVNNLLDHADMLTGDQDMIDRVMGQAIYLRAYFYFYLVRAYGGVPLITHAQTLDEDLAVTRNSYEECVAFIADEMDRAADLLPLQWDGPNLGRPTKGTALAVKARMLLYAASPLNNPENDLTKWQAAADAAKAVIDLDLYELYPEYDKLFLDDNNQEVIFDVQWAYPYRVTSDPAEIVSAEFIINPQGLNGAFGMNRPTQEYVDMFEMANGKPITDPTSGYDPNNPYEGRDPRFYASIFYNGVPWREDTVETFINGKHGPGAADLYETGSTMTGYYCRKFTDPSIPCVYLVDEIKANWILIRYAEVLLNYAEAQIALGHEEEARTYINMVRQRAGMPDTDASGDDLVAVYRNERTVELGMEEHRYFDIRRWKIAEDVLNGYVHKMTVEKNNDGTFAYTVEPMSPRSFPERMYRQPIPIDEIRKNPNLQQNPGYE